MQNHTEAKTARQREDAGAEFPRWHRHQGLRETVCGAALADLLNRYPSDAAAARAIGVSSGVITSCVVRGQASRSIALLAEKNLEIPKEMVRPDLDEAGWQAKSPGRQIGASPERDGFDQITLAKLAKHFGSVRKFSAAAAIRVGLYHSWMTRNRISAWAIPRLCDLDIPESIRARLMDDEARKVDTKSAPG